MAADVERISPPKALERLEMSPRALLVCAYDSEEKFRQNHLDGAVSLDGLRSRESSLSRDQELIFYCA